MKRKFELISPDKELSVNTNWKKCFICQEETNSEILQPYHRKVVIAVTMTSKNDDEKKANSKESSNPMLSFFQLSDGLFIKWAHAVNSRSKLIQSINNGAVMFLEADVMLDPIMNRSMMAHPPAFSSDITLKEWLEISLKTDKGIKLDVKQTKALNDTVTTLEELLFKHSYGGPLLLNADVFPGPNNNHTNPVDPHVLINTFERLGNAVLSPGWTTDFIGNKSLGYTMDNVRKMYGAVKDLKQFITFPVRASLVGISKKPLLWLLNQNTVKYSLTVWTSSKDEYSVESLKYLREFPENVFYDLPDDEIEALKNLNMV